MKRSARKRNEAQTTTATGKNEVALSFLAGGAVWPKCGK